VRTTAARRRHPAASLLLVAVALLLTGGIYGLVATVGQPTAVAASTTADQTKVQEGRELFAIGCATCHGLGGQGGPDGPSLIGVGAAAVDFQVSSGRMPLAAPGAQAERKKPIYNEDQIAAMAAYVASLGPGPAIPSAKDYTAVERTEENYAEVLATGGELFRTNCAQCHNFAGVGAALSQGKYAPSLMPASDRQIYEAMLTGPQSMPIFNDKTITPEDKKAIITFIDHLKQGQNPGGLALGSFGPVTEGLFLFTVGLGALIAVAVWIGVKAK